MSDYKDVLRLSVDHVGVPVRVNGLTYSATFTAQFMWQALERHPFWDCICIEGLVVRCLNGEDVYDGFSEKSQRDIDQLCYVFAIENEPPAPKSV